MHDSGTLYCVEENKSGTSKLVCYSGLELAFGVHRPARLTYEERVAAAVLMGLGTLSLAGAVVAGVFDLAAQRRRRS